jgi:hypothetical protein
MVGMQSRHNNLDYIHTYIYIHIYAIYEVLLPLSFFELTSLKFITLFKFLSLKLIYYWRIEYILFRQEI